jgi:hypothetical protein
MTDACSCSLAKLCPAHYAQRLAVIASRIEYLTHKQPWQDHITNQRKEAP